MRLLQSVVGIIAAAGLIYLAFIVGAFVVRVLLGLVAIALVVLVLMRLFSRGRRVDERPERPPGRV